MSDIKDLKKEYDKYLSHSLIKELKLSDEEIDKWLSRIIKIVDQDNECKKSKSNDCIMSGFQHHTLIRDKDTVLKIHYIKCPKRDFKTNWIDREFKWNKDNTQTLSPFLDTCNPSKSTIIRKYFIPILKKMQDDEAKQHGIFLYGDYGHGKTHLTTIFGNTAADLFGKKICLTRMSKFVQKLKENFDNTASTNKMLSKRLKEVDVLIFDDLGAERALGWFYDQYFFEILHERHESNKLTFFTSNYDLVGLRKKWKETTNMNYIDIDRIIERIKALVGNQEVGLKDKNYRY